MRLVFKPFPRFYTSYKIAFLYFDRENFLTGAEVFGRNAGELTSVLTVSKRGGVITCCFSKKGIERLKAIFEKKEKEEKRKTVVTK